MAAVAPKTNKGHNLGTSDLRWSTVYAGDLNLDGDLTVTGTVTAVESTNLKVTDARIELNKDASDDTVDSGIVVKYVSGAGTRYGIFFRDASADSWALYSGLSTDPTGAGATVDLSDAGTALSYLKANIDATEIKIGNTLITATAAELNILDGVTATTAEINLLDGVTSTTAELNILDGVTSTATELNILDGVTSTTAELNILDGVTSTAAELNLVDGSAAGAILNSKAVIYGDNGEVNATKLQVAGADITSSVAELNKLDGVTATTAEINYLDVTTLGTSENSKAVTQSNSGVVTIGATNGDQVLDIASHDAADGGLKLAGTLVTSTAAELNLLDGVTSTTAELNILDGVTSTATELNILDGVTSTTAELNILDGVTSTAAELNKLDGVTATTAEINYLDVTTLGTSENSKAVTQSNSGVVTLGATNGDQVLDIASHDAVDGGLKLAGTLVTATAAELNILDGVTSTTAELNILDGVTSTAAELNILDGVTSTAAELNKLDGVTATTAEINYLDITTQGISENSKVVTQNGSGVVTIGATNGDQVLDIASHDAEDGGLKLAGTLITATAAELNILDGVTATTAELNILDGVTSTAAELNILDGVTSTATELNILDGVTSTAAELNILDGVTATTAEINYLDVTTLGTSENSKAVTQSNSGVVTLGATNGDQVLDIASHDAVDGGLKLAGTLVTSTAAELNILDGVTSTTAELNILDGVTSTTAEINLLDGSTANSVVNSKAVIYGSSGEVAATSLTAGTVDINGGAIDGAAIGANSHSTGKFTNLETTGNLTLAGDLEMAGGGTIELDANSGSALVVKTGASTVLNVDTTGADAGLEVFGKLQVTKGVEYGVTSPADNATLSIDNHTVLLGANVDIKLPAAGDNSGREFILIVTGASVTIDHANNSDPIYIDGVDRVSGGAHGIGQHSAYRAVSSGSAWYLIGG